MTETVNPHKIYMWVTAATMIMRETTSKKLVPLRIKINTVSRMKTTSKWKTASKRKTTHQMKKPEQAGAEL